MIRKLLVVAAAIAMPVSAIAKVIASKRSLRLCILFPTRFRCSTREPFHHDADSRRGLDPKEIRLRND